MGASPLRGRTFPDPMSHGVKGSRRNIARNKHSVSGEVHGNFVACLFTRPGFEPSIVIPVPWLLSVKWRRRYRLRPNRGRAP